MDGSDNGWLPSPTQPHPTHSQTCPSTPWDDRNGWLGVKYPMTYLPVLACMEPTSQILHMTANTNDRNSSNTEHTTSYEISLSLALDPPSFGIHSQKTCSTLSSFKMKLKTFLLSQYCMCCVLWCVCVCACACVHVYSLMCINSFNSLCSVFL